MSSSLLVLCLAAFAVAATLVSGVIAVALRAFERVALLLEPGQRAWLWLGLAAAPTAAGVTAVLVSFLPALGFGQDHCLAHGPHHPHLCPHHAGGAPGLVLVVVAALLVARLATLTFELARGILLSHRTARSLAGASEVQGGVLVFPSAEPQAFVLGTLRPRAYVSRGLLALSREIVDPVLAHERAHARRRDLLWRSICPLLAAGHLPSVAARLRSRLAAAQELAADSAAADAIPGGPLEVAAALVELSRRGPSLAPGLSFTGGNVEARVRALLDDRRARPAWPARSLLIAALAAAIVPGATHELIHHGLETVLGALS